MQRDRVYLPEESQALLSLAAQGGLKDLMAVLESSFDGIFITDGDGTPIWVNHSYEIISGLTAKDVVGIPMKELVAQGKVSASASLMAIDQGKAVTIDQTFPSGKQVVVTSTPIYDKDDKIYMVATNVRDISELISLRADLDRQRDLSARYEQEIAIIRDQLHASPELVAEDPSTLDLLRIVGRAALLDTVVLILGETGSGKERIASYIHHISPRARKNFIRVNCGAIPENLAESELFGYERGAFTGANREGKAGLFEVANEGTIFLDEVGELSLATQTKLLRVLQEKELTRVGGSKPIKIDVRVIAATNRDLEKCVREGTFREDLYYRLSVFPVRVPPLRERPLDIPKLAEDVITELNHTYEHKKVITPAAEAVLVSYAWPGNVRELRNVMERAFIMSDGEEIRPQDLAITGDFIHPTVHHADRTPASGGPVLDRGTFQEQVEIFEAGLIAQALEAEGTLRGAARRLDMDPATLLRRKKKYEGQGLLAPAEE